MGAAVTKGATGFAIGAGGAIGAAVTKGATGFAIGAGVTEGLGESRKD